MTGILTLCLFAHCGKVGMVRFGSRSSPVRAASCRRCGASKYGTDIATDYEGMRWLQRHLQAAHGIALKGTIGVTEWDFARQSHVVRRAMRHMESLWGREGLAIVCVSEWGEIIDRWVA